MIFFFHKKSIFALNSQFIQKFRFCFMKKTKYNLYFTQDFCFLVLCIIYLFRRKYIFKSRKGKKKIYKHCILMYTNIYHTHAQIFKYLY